MSVNECGADRFTRWSIGIILVLMALSALDWTAVVVGIGGVALLLTGAIGWCPLYSLFHITSVDRKA